MRPEFYLMHVDLTQKCIFAFVYRISYIPISFLRSNKKLSEC